MRLGGLYSVSLSCYVLAMQCAVLTWVLQVKRGRGGEVGFSPYHARHALYAARLFRTSLAYAALHARYYVPRLYRFARTRY